MSQDTELMLAPALDLDLDAALVKIANLEVALQSARMIGVALGIVMATQKVTQERAFEILRCASQDGNVKLRDIAAVIEMTGALPIVSRGRIEPA